jgi:phosphotransferase system HPr (HPr) family protein
VTTVRLTVRNPSGIHARPAATFVRTAGRFRAAITIANVTAGRGPVNAKSILSLMPLGATQGSEIEVTADGEDAEAAIEAIREAVEGGLGEDLETGP